jgi:hypothetical protein
MKLTIIRLQLFSDQDRIDLGKSGRQDPDADPLDDHHRLYAARFNERLLGAVRVTLSGVEGELSDLCVRSDPPPRRRAIFSGRSAPRNPEISRWRIADGVEDRGVMAAFMQALGFSARRRLGKAFKAALI